MSDNLKPLIFVSPLSDTLKKLREVMGPSAEAEGIEIYDAENMEEACQLIPSVGQSVTLMSHPKHCALTLQKNKKYFKKMNSKMILLSSKSIPRKTLDKFMKVGLTENIVEPVNPKTLVYKVKLQLKSIATAKEEKEMNRKFDQDSNEKTEDEEFSLKKDQKSNNDHEEEIELREKKKAQEIEMENYSNVQRKEQQEESIETHYKGKSSQQEDPIEEETKEKKNYKEEEIDTHYKGHLTKSIDIEEDNPSEKHSHDIDVDLDEMDALRSQVSLEVEQDLQKKQALNQEAPLEQEKPKKATKLDLEEDSKDSLSKKEAEDLGGHYKGELSKGLSIEDDESDFKEKKQAEKMSSMMEGESTSHLDVEDDNEASLKEDRSDDFYNEEKDKLNALDIEDDKENDEENLFEVEDDNQKKGPDNLKDEDISEEEESHNRAQFEIEQEKENEDSQGKKVDEIDKYLRSKSAQKLKVDEEKEDLYQDQKEKQREELDQEDCATLDILDESKKKDLENEVEAQAEDRQKRNSASLDIEEEQTLYNHERKDPESKEKDLLDQKAKLEIDDEKGSRKKLEQQHKDDSPLKRSDAKSEHIKTHYSSREGIKHGNGDWDSKWDKSQKPLEDDFPKSESENALIIEQEDLGEQTINYEKLKADFDSISYDRLPEKKKISTEYDGPIAKIKTFGKTIFSELENQDVIVQVEEIQDELEEDTRVFEPQPLGIDHAVLVLNYYMKEDVQIHQVCKLISEQILKTYSGYTSFYSYDQKMNQHLPLYRHLVEGELGEAPSKPTEEEKDGLSKSELKSLMKEYDNDLFAYNQQKEELNQDWQQAHAQEIPSWQQATTPSWKDHTFQGKENYYIVPFFEGKRKLGYAVVTFEDSFNPTLEKPLEVILETARGLFLECSQSEKNKPQNLSKEKKENHSKAKGGFLSSLWKKVAS